MSNSTPHFVYQEPAIEFVTVAAQTCLLLEHLGEESHEENLNRLLTILPLLYLKARLLQCPERELDGEVERFVSEDDYNRVLMAVKDLLGEDDTYLDVLMEDRRYSDEPWTAYVSENIADVYQELADLAANYRTGNESVMNDALAACIEAFDEHWGQKVLNALRALHAVELNYRNYDRTENE